MKRISLKEMLAMAAVVATSTVAYAAPEATITLTYPMEQPEVAEQLHFLYTEWSEPVNYSTERDLTIVSQDRETMVVGHFAENEMGEPMESVYINLEEEITKPGLYILTIPEGALYNKATYDESTATNEVTTITYLINETQGGDTEVKALSIVSTDPENGATVNELSAIHLVFDGPIDAGFGESFIVYRDGFDSGSTAQLNYDSLNFNDEDKAELTISPSIKAPGTYTITIPANVIANYDQNSALGEVTLTYTIEGEGGGDEPGIDDTDVNYNFNPTEIYPKDGAVIDDNDGTGMGNLSLVNIKFAAYPYVKEGFEFVFVNENGESFKSTKPSPSGKDDETVNYLISTVDGNAIILGVEDLPSGKYTLTVPKGVIGDKDWAASGYTSGRSNEEFTCSWDYTAKRVVDIPKDVIDAPLEILTFTVSLPNGETVNVLTDPALEGLPAESTLNILTSKNEYAQALQIIIKNDKTGEILWNIWTTPSRESGRPSIGVKGEDGLFHFTHAGNDPFYEGTTYTFEISAYENFEVPESEKIYMQTAEIKVKGLTEGIVYSNVEIEDVTPEPGTVFTSYDERSFTVTYSAPVEIVTEGEIMSGYVIAYMGTQPFESIESNEDKTEWTFTIPESELNECLGGGIICDIVANDMEGRRVYPEFYPYNAENYEDGFQQYVYNCYLGNPEVTVVPGAGVVKDLTTFEFTCPEAEKESIGVQGIDGEGNALEIVLLDAEGNQVAMVDRKNYVEIDSNGNVIDENNEDFNVVVTKVIMHLDTEITEAGEYTLVIPAAYFMTGDQYSACGNRPQEIKYTVDPTYTGVAAVAGEAANVAVEGGKVVIAGAEGAVEVYAINGAKVASVAPQGGNAVVALEKGVYVVVVNGKSVKVIL